MSTTPHCTAIFSADVLLITSRSTTFGLAVSIFGPVLPNQECSYPQMLLLKEAWHFSAKRFSKEDIHRPAGSLEASRQSFVKRKNLVAVVVVVVV
jgi:hypothetical protein